MYRLASILLLSTISLASPVAAQSSGGSGTSSSSGGSSGGSRASALTDEQALIEEGAAPDAPRSGFEPGELQNETYLFLGAMARALIVPTFIQSLFVAGGATPINGVGGLYFNYRHNGFNVQIEAFYQSMYNDGFYRGTGDPEFETEFIQSRLGVVMGEILFGWAFDITDWLAFELSFGLGGGGVIGSLMRQEAYPTSSGAWAACAGRNMAATGDTTTPASTVASYCEDSLELRNPANGRLDDDRIRGGTYQINEGRADGGVTSGNGPNPLYFGSGGIPPIFAVVDLPRFTFRIKPLHQLQIRIDAAYNGYGFSFGGSMGYGF